MNAPHVFRNPLNSPPRTQRWLLVCAAIVGVSLMSAYVQTLHDSLARAEQLRAVFLLPVKKAQTPRPVSHRATALPPTQQAASLAPRRRQP